MEPLADRCRANGWRIEPHSHPQFGQIVFVRGGAGLMTVATDHRPFSSPSVLIVPVNTVHGFEYGMDSDGWVLTVAEPYLRNLLERMPELRDVWSEPRILSLAVDDEETSDIHREHEMYPAARWISDPAERFLYLFTEYQADGIARNSGQWHAILRADPDQRSSFSPNTSNTDIDQRSDQNAHGISDNIEP